MMRNVLIQTQSLTCGASDIPSRSFKSGIVSRNSGCKMLARGRLVSHLRNDTIIATSFCIRAFSFLSGYRGLSRVLQNAPSVIADAFQLHAPFSFQGVFHVLKRSNGVTHEYGSFVRGRGFFSQGEQAHV